MSINRDSIAANLYRSSDKEERRKQVMFAQCDTGRDIGLLRAYMASDFNSLRNVVNRKVSSRVERIKRKADFFFTLARMADRLDRIPKFKEIGI